MKFKVGDVVTWEEENDDGSMQLYTIVDVNKNRYVHGFCNDEGEHCTVSMGKEVTEENARLLTKLELALA